MIKTAQIQFNNSENVNRLLKFWIFRFLSENAFKIAKGYFRLARLAIQSDYK